MAETLRAMARFGLGPSAADRAAVGDDPRGWVLDQVGAPVRSKVAMSATDAIRLAEDAARERRNLRRAMAATEASGTAMADGMDAMADGMDATADGMDAMRPASAMAGPREFKLLSETRSLEGAAATPAPFAERWVRHWANHFTVRGRRPVGWVLTEPFRAEAIEPHAWGSFHDLLLAATLHPAMLVDLDNRGSVGPNSAVGAHMGRGANENLAREVLELHTLGSDGGYGQDDVSAFALALTGWNVVGWRKRDGGTRATGGMARFRARAHEPGARTVLGRRFAEDDGTGDQARAILAHLAAHPSTARNVGRRVAAHFHSPGPGRAALASELERAFAASEGDLFTVAAVLVRRDEPWADEAVLTAPRDHVTGWMRLLPGAMPPRQALRELGRLGQPMGHAPSPEGWPEAEGWGSPGGLKTRLDLASLLGLRAGAGRDPMAVADAAIGPDLTDETRTALLRAASPAQGLAILARSPEVMLR